MDRPPMRSVTLHLCLCLCGLLYGFAPPVFALEPDQILLIVNKNVPQGQRLAEYYAERRNVPARRICALDLPESEEMSFDDYERRVVPPVRDFLKQNNLEHKVTCLLMFYGVPIRIAARANTPENQAEIAEIKEQLGRLQDRVRSPVDALERLASGLPVTQPALVPESNDLQSMAVRADSALRRITLAGQGMADPEKRRDLEDRTKIILGPLIGATDLLERELADAGGVQHAYSSPAAGRALARITQFRSQVADLRDRRYDPESRRQLRELAGENLGPFELARWLQGQLAYLAPDNSAAAFDSELALLWWWEYPRSNWLPNPLHYRNVYARPAPVMMTMRLDGPQSGTARDIILASIQAEAEGLHGQVCLDSQGIPAFDKNGKPIPFGQYDQTLRNLADLIRAKTRLSLTFDDQKDVLPANSVNDVAIYCGWYSVNQYIPACHFNTGAVGFHIASYTMVTLRQEDPRGWVRGLLNDGCVATLGPVAEPYLQAFPAADEFFPLLFTGKLTLAEVYWKTTPCVSWMISMIGDPLYTPYKKNPAIAVNDLPRALRAAVSPPAPSTAAAAAQELR